jgi:nitrogen regulatory protein P-II 1
MKEIKAIVRKERVQDVVSALRSAGVPRLTLCHVHSVGSGVDPEDYRLSFEEGTAYTEKTKIEVVSRAEDVQRFIDIIRTSARTGHRGDGVIFVSDIERTVKVRTGDENALALI